MKSFSLLWHVPKSYHLGPKEGVFYDFTKERNEETERIGESRQKKKRKKKEENNNQKFKTKRKKE